MPKKSLVSLHKRKYWLSFSRKFRTVSSNGFDLFVLITQDAMRNVNRSIQIISLTYLN